MTIYRVQFPAFDDGGTPLSLRPTDEDVCPRCRRSGETPEDLGGCGCGGRFWVGVGFSLFFEGVVLVSAWMLWHLLI